MCIMCLLVCEVKLFLIVDNGPKSLKKAFLEKLKLLKLKHCGGGKPGRSRENKRMPGCLPRPHTILFHFANLTAKAHRA